MHRWGVCRRHQWMEGKEAWRRCRQRWKAVAQRVQGSGAGKGRNRGRGSQLRRAARRAGERAEAAEERLASAHCSVRQLVHRVEAAEEGMGVWRKKYWAERAAPRVEAARGQRELLVLADELGRVEGERDRVVMEWEGRRMWERGRSTRGELEKEKGDAAALAHAWEELEGMLVEADAMKEEADRMREEAELELELGRRRRLVRGGAAQRKRQKGRGGAV